jgi:hypothetical protein
VQVLIFLQFVLEEDALAAGFSSIRAMSYAFFTRAKVGSQNF